MALFPVSYPHHFHKKMNAAVTKGSFEAYNRRTIVFLPQTTYSINVVVLYSKKLRTIPLKRLDILRAFNKSL